jgi:hypothetical protein
MLLIWHGHFPVEFCFQMLEVLECSWGAIPSARGASAPLMMLGAISRSEWAPAEVHEAAQQFLAAQKDEVA